MINQEFIGFDDPDYDQKIEAGHEDALKQVANQPSLDKAKEDLLWYAAKTKADMLMLRDLYKARRGMEASHAEAVKAFLTVEGRKPGESLEKSLTEYMSIPISELTRDQLLVAATEIRCALASVMMSLAAANKTISECCYRSKKESAPPTAVAMSVDEIDALYAAVREAEAADALIKEIA